jgi:hypothetical protein
LRQLVPSPVSTAEQELISPWQFPFDALECCHCAHHFRVLVTSITPSCKHSCLLCWGQATVPSTVSMMGLDNNAAINSSAPGTLNYLEGSSRRGARNTFSPSNVAWRASSRVHTKRLSYHHGEYRPAITWVPHLQKDTRKGKRVPKQTNAAAELKFSKQCDETNQDVREVLY